MAPPQPKVDPGELKRLDEWAHQTVKQTLDDFRRLTDMIEKHHRERQARHEDTAPIRAKAAAEAWEYRGSELWRQWAIREYEGRDGDESYWLGNYKCNLFVYEMLMKGGAQVELQFRENKINQDFWYPPLARQWADPNFAIPGFEVLRVPPDVPQPGDVAAIANDSWGASGHMGIVVGPPQSPPNMTVSAKSDGVVHARWGFQDDQKDKVVFRRYVGWPEHSASPVEPGTRSSGVAYETVPPAPEKPRERNKCASPVRGTEK